MRVRGPFAEYQLRGLGRSSSPAAQAVRCSTVDEALGLLGQMQLDDPVRLGPLLLEVEPIFGDGVSPQELLERVARLIARGLIEVIRVPLLPLSSEMPELYELPVYEPPVANEISDGVSVLAEAAVERAPVVEVAVEVTPLPVLQVHGLVTPPVAQTG